MIWLGDKLFKIESDYGATLEESYKKHLMNYMGNYDYWKLLDSKKHYKNATVKKMSDMCGLLNSICKLINEYNKSTTKIDRNRLRNTFTQCLNFYRSIHSSVNECKPYLHLLDSLKMMYEIFRATKMVNNNFSRRDKDFLSNQIQAITTFNGENKYLLTVNAIFSFDDKECRKVKSNDEQIGKNIELKKSQGTALPKKKPTATQGQVPGKLPPGKPPTMSRPRPQPRPQPQPQPQPQPRPQPQPQPQPRPQPQPPPKYKPEGKKQAFQPPIPPQKKEQSPPPSGVPSALTPVSSSQNDPSLQTSQTGGTNSQSETKDLGSNNGNKGDGANVQGGAISQPGSLGGKPNPVDNPSPGSKAGDQGSSGSQTQHSGNPVPATDGAGTPQSPDTIPPPQPAQPVQPPVSPGPGTTITTSPTVTPGTTTKASKDTQNGVINPQDNAQTGLNKIQDPKGGTSSQQANQGDKQVNQNGAPVNPTVPGSSGGESKDNTQMKTNQVGDSSSTPQISGSENQGTKQGVSSGGIGTLKNPVDGVRNAGSGSKASPSTDVKNQHQNPDPNQGVPGGGVPGGGESGGAGGGGSGAGGGGSGAGGGGSGAGGGGSGAGGGGSGTGDGGSGANGGGSTQGDQGDKSGGSSNPASSTSEGSVDFGSSFLKFLLNGTEHFNKVPKFVKESQQMLEDAKDKINGAYNSAVDNLKGAYNASSSYFSEFINNVANQLNQADPPPKLGGNQTGPGNPSGGGNSSNQSPLPQSPSATDPKNPPSTLPLPPLPNPPPILPPDPSKDPLQQKTPPLQSQPNAQQTTQVILSNQKSIVQLVKSPSFNPILKKPWNIFPTTWNGSGDCKPEVKFMNTTLVCCTSEQCSLTGISITLVLIPIILLIAYKYLSFGSSKKSEKKNMKRVINFHDGNRKTKIIISSNDRSKHLKSVINSVGGKKNPLSNIYKLIQADPMPFINLFFLLIFFVYKRKRDTIE
ncbi:PIR protein CIR protein [Plasmodium vinckei petteri]|nr:PIR protein CIR protein [Plasmodium vinckei petteri]